MKLRIIFTLFLLGFYCYSQEFNGEEVTIYEEDEYSVVYGIGKYEIRRQITPYTLTDTLELKQFLYEKGIQEAEIQKNKQVTIPHYWMAHSDTVGQRFFLNRIIYFVGDRPEAIESIIFSSIDKVKKTEIDLSILNDILKRKQRKEWLLTKTDFPFAGRRVKMQENWQWASINRLKEAETHSQFSWTVHKTLEEAVESNEIRFKIATHQVKGVPYRDYELLSEEKVSVLFEEIPTQATKILIKEVETSPILKNYRKEAILVVYSFAQKVRQRYIACVLSFYESEAYKKEQLTPLLQSFIRL